VRASPRCSETSPQELKAQEGIEWLAGLTRLSVTTDRCSDQSPGVWGGRIRRRWGNSPVGDSRETTRGHDSSMRRAGWAAGKIPEVRIPDVAAG
jgi:hypothetical protein